MGNAGSKTAQNGVRKFPTRAQGAAPTSVPRAVRQAPKPSSTKDEAIRPDAVHPEHPAHPDPISPAFSDRLKKMGVVQPNPTFSPSSTASPFPDFPDGSRDYPLAPTFPAAKSNATLGVLEARRRLEEQARAEFDNMGKSTDRGREFLDIATIRKILVLRQRGEQPADIESRLRLKSGVVQRLGPAGIVVPVRAQQAA
ncbi:hypothetical protein GQ53DRAFT_741354 [Thozetella sp. PMI_491]|nr:hypothetical protein GQ53DRAFT_741354 [Thozetella sp. PMI_491]